MLNNAKWIGIEITPEGGATAENTPAPIFRKEFSVDEKPAQAKPQQKLLQRAKLQISGLGLYTAEINGKPVTDEVLTPPVSRFDKTVYFNEYDVLPLLQEGKNCIGVTLGNGWYNYPSGATWDFEKATWRHHPKLIACLSLFYEDGKEEHIVTNSSWRASCGATIYNFARDGEDYDARLFKNGWNLAGFDDSSWQNAYVCRSPGGILKKADYFPPVRVIKTREPVIVNGNVYDFGQNTSGWVKITVKGEAGSEVKIRYSEHYTKEKGIDQTDTNRFISTGRGHSGKYILAGKSEAEIWHPVFTYYGFRYAEITVKGKAEILKAEAQQVHTDLNAIGSFESGDDMLNRIHNASLYSTLSNYHGIPTDCPHREQNGWTGDACISSEQALMNFDIKNSYRKWLLDFKDVQRPSGQIPGIVPTSSWGYNWGSGPAWDSALILIPLAIFELDGDISIAAEMWENMELYMEFFGSMAEEYLVEFGLGDWCPPKNAKVPPVKLTDTAYYYADAKAMAKIARALGNGREEYYLTLAENIKKAFREKFVKNGEVVFNDSQTAIACAIYQGLLEENEIPAAAAKLAELVRKNGNHIDCGILGMKYIFSALSENGYAQTAYNFTVNPTYPSYAYWINSGMTTLCEDWEMEYSLLHHMYSEVDYWFYRHLAGIQPDKPGFRKLVIKPCFVENVCWVKASHKGIEVFWDKEKLILKTPVPAKVYIGKNIYSAEPGTHEYKRN